MNPFFIILPIIAYIVGFIVYCNLALNKLYGIYNIDVSKEIIAMITIIFWPLLFIVDSFAFIIRFMGRLTGIK